MDDHCLFSQTPPLPSYYFCYIFIALVGEGEGGGEAKGGGRKGRREGGGGRDKEGGRWRMGKKVWQRDVGKEVEGGEREGRGGNTVHVRRMGVGLCGELESTCGKIREFKLWRSRPTAQRLYLLTFFQPLYMHTAASCNNIIQYQR